VAKIGWKGKLPVQEKGLGPIDREMIVDVQTGKSPLENWSVVCDGGGLRGMWIYKGRSVVQP